jgi:hypothetical protein
MGEQGYFLTRVVGALAEVLRDAARCVVLTQHYGGADEV